MKNRRCFGNEVEQVAVYFFINGVHGLLLMYFSLVDRFCHLCAFTDNGIGGVDGGRGEVALIMEFLSYAGFTEIREEDPWQIERGGKYVVTRNGSALMAFTIPEDGGHAFRITASHGDSPSFKIKENPELRDAAYVRLKRIEGHPAWRKK